MKILFIVSWLYNNSDYEKIKGNFHVSLVKELNNFGEVILYYPFDTSLEQDYIVKVENKITIYRSKWNNRNLVESLHYYNKCSKKIMKLFNPDIIHANVCAPAGMLSIWLKFIYKKKLIITEHIPVEMMSKKKWLFYEVAYRNSDYLTAVSKNLADKLNERYKKCDFNVIYNGIEKIESIVDEKNYRRKNSINCCIVGAFYDKNIKGYQYLLPAVSECIKGGMNITLHICGSGLYEEFYKQLSVELGIDNNCIFYGGCNKSQVYSIISQMDFCVSSSIVESAGVFVEESLCLGRPVLVTKSGGADSLVDESNSIVVEKKNVTDLIEGIKKMSSSYYKFDSDEIKENARKIYTLESVVKKYIEVYSSLL